MRSRSELLISQSQGAADYEAKIARLRHCTACDDYSWQTEILQKCFLLREEIPQKRLYAEMYHSDFENGFELNSHSFPM